MALRGSGFSAGLVEELVNTGELTSISADYTALVSDRIIRADSSSNTITITLPPVAESKHQFLAIESPDGNTNTVTISATDGLNTVSDTTAHDSAEGASLWYSTGRQWLLIGAIA